MPEPKNSPLSRREISIEDLRRLAGGGFLFAVVDSCRVQTAPRKASELGTERALCLYRETAEQDFWDVAPYLFALDEAMLDWIARIAKIEGWGILIASKADLLALRFHLRHFLKVQEPKGAIWYFRFYDPRVLQPFLPACDESELIAFFGPVLAYGILHPDGITADLFRAVAPDPNEALSHRAFMFRLRLAHIEALVPQSEAAFAAELIEFLTHLSPASVASLPLEQVKQQVTSGISRARRYGFKRNSSIAAFVAIMFDVSPTFDEQRNIRAVLENQSLAPDLRIDELVGRTSAQDWREANSLPAV